MSALVYIIRKSAKNSLRELLKKPGKLIMYLLVIAVIIAVIITSAFTEAMIEEPEPLFWFTGILFLFVTLFFAIGIAKGLSGGDIIFEMNDVNLLFVSPVNSRKILLYGIARMAKLAFAAGFFILFQTNSLANFGIDFGGVLVTFVGFLISVVVMTTASLIIYSMTNGRPRRKLFVKCVAVLLFAPLIITLAVNYIETRDLLFTVESTTGSVFLRFVPVVGWTAAGVSAFLTGSVVSGIVYLALNLLLCAGMIVCIMLSNPDYYEDVLVATETAYEKKRAIAEGSVDTAATSKRKVAVRNVGISGVGGAALFGKHMRESFRQNRFGFLGLPSVLIIIGAIAVCMLTGDMFITLQILVWIQILFIGTGRGMKELYTHYIFLIPESSFKKILWSNMEIMARTVVENVLIFVVSGILLRESALLIFAYFIVYTLFSFLLLGINLLSMRFTGADISAGLLITIYYVMVVVVMLPGVAAGILLGFAIGGGAGLLVGILTVSAWELIAGVCCFALSRGVLHSCDICTIKTAK